MEIISSIENQASSGLKRGIIWTESFSKIIPKKIPVSQVLSFFIFSINQWKISGVIKHSYESQINWTDSYLYDLIELNINVAEERYAYTYMCTMYIKNIYIYIYLTFWFTYQRIIIYVCIYIILPYWMVRWFRDSVCLFTIALKKNGKSFLLNYKNNYYSSWVCFSMVN